MEDCDIVELYWNRSESAITETSKKYGRLCKSIAYHILSNHEDVDECVNDTYLGVWDAIPPQRPKWFRAFVGRITRNLALDRYDYNTAGKRNQEFNQILSELSDCISAPENVEAQYEDGQIAKEISSFLSSSSYDSRNVFLRRYWYADSIAEIAERFSMSESKVKSMLFRTRNKLKKHLEKVGITI